MSRSINVRFVTGVGAGGIGLVVAGMAALALSSAPDAPGIADIQFGERGSQARIAVICDDACIAMKRTTTEFALQGAAAHWSLDLSSRSRFVSGVSARPDGAETSAIAIMTRIPVEYSNTKACKVAGRAAVCIDLFFTEAGDAPSVKQEIAARSASKKTAAVDASGAPPLRETATERYNRFAALSPPERLAQPAPARLATLRPVRETLQEIARQEAAESKQPAPQEITPFGFAERAEWILGKSLNVTTCAQARTILQNDPWALDSMVSVGFCAAVDGDLEGADDILSRLLEYTPDNYAANVGRALIAAEVGEKGVARNYFQRALNALPPIEESNRIVQAMNAL